MSKLLDRVALILNQAENASTPEEAATYMEKAQQLATLAQVDLEVARQHQADKTKREVPETRNITIAGFVNTRVEANAGEKVLLISAIANANSVKLNVAHNSTYVIAFGLPSDIDVVEALYSSLVVQMTTAAQAAIKAGEHKQDTKETYWDARTYTVKTRRPDARRFKTAFYQAFTGRISNRLSKARREAVASTPTVAGQTESSGALVLRSKDVEVADFYKQASTAKGSWKGGRNQASSSAGSAAGRTAGDRARIGSQAGITAGRTKISA